MLGVVFLTLGLRAVRAERGKEDEMLSLGEGSVCTKSSGTYLGLGVIIGA